jgi:hypothetical protein
MATTVLRGANKKEEAKKLLKTRPLLVLFFMDGCPHCEANKPAWEQAKKKAGVRTAEIEASATPEEEATGFPTMKFKPLKGKERVTTGEKHSSAEIIRDLGLNRRLTRHSSRRRSRHATRRRLRH